MQITSTNPATGDVLWQGAAADTAAVTAALARSRAVGAQWAATPPEERQALVERFRDVLQARTEHLAEVIAQETGKPRWEARTEVAAMVGKVAISVRACGERTGTARTEVPGSVPAAHSVVRHRPHGVMAVFGPYNFPGHLPNGHMVPALLAGNTVVFKPSEFTPWTAEETLACWREAGLPDGVAQVVHGGADTGRALAAGDIDGLLFTGSSAVGRQLHAQFAGRPEVLLALEMGGNNPLIVWDVADTDAAALLVVQSAYQTAGQRCTCARRLIVPQGAAGDAVLEAVLALLPRLRMGRWDAQPDPFMGPLIAVREAEKALAAQRALLDAGAQALATMAPPAAGLPFLTPGLLDVTHVANRPDAEVFAPLLQVIRVPTVEAALQEANATRYGLAAGLLSDDPALYAQAMAGLRAGVINWNRPLTGASSAAPFGGVGWSGNHRPSALYAADYCAYPVASLEAPALAAGAVPGIADA